MGISFKVARAGKRYRPKLLQIDDKDSENGATNESLGTESEGDLAEVGDRVANNSSAFAKSELHFVSEDHEVSFTLNLFPDGFSVGKANELLDGVPKKLPYDGASKALFCAIEYGCLPGDILDDIPCKYVDGALLCEIRDYRNTLSEEEDSSSVEKSPVIYKVVLQLCVENVVKDISSISDDSWTYSDLLEVESRILKALRPVLHLNPKPMPHRFGEKTPRKKLDLGISWSRKRKIVDTSVPDLVVCNKVTGFDKLQCIQYSNSHSDVAENREISHYQHIIPRSGPTSPENNNLQVTTSESLPVPSQSDCVLADNWNHSVSKAQTPSNRHFTPKQYLSNCQSDLRKASTLTLGGREICGTRVISGPTNKIPKQEPLDFSQAETGLASEQWWKRKLLHQRIEAEKLLLEKTDCRKRPLVSLNSDKQVILEGIPKLRAGIATCRVKEEPGERSEFSHIANSGKIIDMRGQSNLQSLISSQPLRANAPLSTALFNHIGQPVCRSTANEIVTRKRGALRVSQVSAGVGNKSASSCLGDSLPREAPMPAKRKSKSRLKGSDSNRVKSPASTSNVDTSNASCITERTSETRLSTVGDLIIDRFSKLEMLTHGYGLNNKNHRPSQVFEKRPFFDQARLAYHLSGSGKGNLQYGNAYNFDANSQENKFNIYRTRTMKFIRSPHVFQRNEIGSSEAQTKLIIMEKLDEGMVEASFVYGDGEVDPIELPRLQSFPNSHCADLFAVQFAVLMEREGYRVISDHIEDVPPHIQGIFSVQQPALTSGTPLAYETIEQSPYMLGPSQLTSHNNFLGGHLIPYGNIQLPPINFPMPRFNCAAQLAPFYQQRQQAINKRAFLEFQKMEREKLQQQLLQRKMMVGGSGVATAHLGTVQSSDRAQGRRNVGLGCTNNVMGMCGSSMSMRGRASMSRFPIMAHNNQQQAELRSPLQHLLATNLAKNVGLPLSLVSHMDQWLQTSQWQLSSASAPQQTEPGNAVVGHESPEPSSRNHGSVGGCNKSSSMELRGVIKSESPI